MKNYRAYGLLFIWGVLSFASPSLADDCSAPCNANRPQDEVWLVDTRALSCASNSEDFFREVRLWKLDGNCRWQSAKLSELLEGPALHTVVWVHGNRVDPDWASMSGVTAYRALTKLADDETPPLRFIIWSWPTSQIRGQLKDVRIKAQRSDPEAYRLATFIDRLPPETSLGLMGFSYGARVVTGALHLLGGGELAAGRLAAENVDGRPMRAVLLAAALDDAWLLPGHYHGRTMSQVDSMLAVNNGCDAVLKRYRLVSCDRCGEALGYMGLASAHRLGQDLEKFEQIDASNFIGRQHAVEPYLHSPELMSLAWEQLAPGIEYATSKKPSKLPEAKVSQKMPATTAAGKKDSLGG